MACDSTSSSGKYSVMALKLIEKMERVDQISDYWNTALMLACERSSVSDVTLKLIEEMGRVDQIFCDRSVPAATLIEKMDRVDQIDQIINDKFAHSLWTLASRERIPEDDTESSSADIDVAKK